MSKPILRFITLFFIISFMIPSIAKAESDLLNKQAVYQYLQAAFHSQVSLSEKHRSMVEVRDILSPYFTDEYNELFLEENLVSENGKYITYGSDFVIYFIPFFSYSEETKVVWDKDHIYAFEFFPKTDEGPVSYNSHYEGVRIDKVDGTWKVAEFLYDNIPAEIIEQAKVDEQVVRESLERKAVNTKFIQSTLQLGFFLHPLESFFRYGNSFFTHM